MKLLNVFLIASILLFHSIHAEGPPASKAILKAAQGLTCYGTLKKGSGFVYVDVDDDFIHSLLPLIKEAGFEEPPYFGPDQVGAHITVVYPNEMVQLNDANLEEEGITIFFRPTACRLVKPPRWKEISAVYFIEVDAPELDQLREKYHLPQREYRFHITIGIKRADSVLPASLASGS